jgi:hypothetical protein
MGQVYHEGFCRGNRNVRIYGPSRVDGGSHIYTLQSVTTWSTRGCRHSQVDSPANFVQRLTAIAAGSAARYSVTVDAGMGHFYHEGFCRGTRNVRIHGPSRVAGVGIMSTLCKV